MKRRMMIVVSMLLLIPSLTIQNIYGEDKSTKLYYEVKATVIYDDGNGLQTIQKVSVGDKLKQPQALGKEHYRFIGWKDKATGLYWNFNDPVTEHMELVAVYEKIDEVDTSVKDVSIYYYLLLGSLGGILCFRKRKLRHER